MNNQTPKQTQLTQQTQLVSSPCDSDNELIHDEKEEDLVWGKLFAIGSGFKSIG